MTFTKKSLGLSFVTQYLELMIHFLGVLVLARVLSPHDIGIYSVAAFLMALLHVFRDFGVANYIIQEHDLTTEKLQAAIGVAIILAWTVALVLLASSRLIANLYQTPEIENLLIIMSASFAISPLSSVLAAVLRREMKFKAILYVKVGSALSHVAVAIPLALSGYGASSLAWANFAGILSFGLLVNILKPKGLPWRPRFTGIREVLSYGSISSAGSVASVAGTNAPDVIIGKVMSMAAAGYFSRANGLIQLFRTLVTGAVMPLILPYFAQIKRKNGDINKPYHQAMELLIVISWPFFGVLGFLASPVVRTLYGPQWDASVPLVQVLCMAGAISSMYLFAGEVMLASGHVRRVTATQIASNAVRIIAVLLASAWGLMAIATVIIGAECAALALYSYFLRKTTGIGFVQVLRGTGKSAIVTLTSLLAPFTIFLIWENTFQNPWLPLLLGLSGACAGWLIGVLVTNHPVKPHLQQLCQNALKGPRP